MSTPFTAELFRGEGKGAWTFVEVPAALAPPVTEGWGRTPVLATVNGKTWETSVWRGSGGETWLPVPAKIRGRLGHGDLVEVEIVHPRPGALQ